MGPDSPLTLFSYRAALSDYPGGSLPMQSLGAPAAGAPRPVAASPVAASPGAASPGAASPVAASPGAASPVAAALAVAIIEAWGYHGNHSLSLSATLHPFTLAPPTRVP